MNQRSKLIQHFTFGIIFLIPFLFGFTHEKPARPQCGQPVNTYSNGDLFSVQDSVSPQSLDQFLREQAAFRAEFDGENKTLHSFITPTHLVPLSLWPSMIDDLDFANMSEALQKQIDHYKQFDPQGLIRLGQDVYLLSQAKKSLEAFQQLLKKYVACKKSRQQKCQVDFESLLKKSFSLYEPTLVFGDPRFNETKNALFTGYYTPAIQVTKQPNQMYSHAIYTRPEASLKRRVARRDIDFHDSLKGLGLEKFYSNNLFALYLAHIQGNAHVYVQGGGNQYLNYAATNGMRFEFISKWMYENHYIDDTSVGSQAKYLSAHPEKQEEIYSTCPSYIYFYSSQQPPMGSGGVSVTPNRSIATDPDYYAFKGLLSFVKSQRPLDSQKSDTPCAYVKFRDFSRFFLDQDMGGAVRGKARADLYFGEGDYAQFAAFNEDDVGSIYFLMLKK